MLGGHARGGGRASPLPGLFGAAATPGDRAPGAEPSPLRTGGEGAAGEDGLRRRPWGMGAPPVPSAGFEPAVSPLKGGEIGLTTPRGWVVSRRRPVIGSGRARTGLLFTFSGRRSGRTRFLPRSRVRCVSRGPARLGCLAFPLTRRELCGYCSRSSPTRGCAADTTGPRGRAFPPSTRAGDQPGEFALLCCRAPSRRGRCLWRGARALRNPRGVEPLSPKAFGGVAPVAADLPNGSVRPLQPGRRPARSINPADSFSLSAHARRVNF